MDEEEKLEPMPPPPAPKAHPIALLPSTQPQKPHNVVFDDNEHLIPQSPPIPHTHPLVALRDESARNVKLQREEGDNMTRQSKSRHHTIITGKRLDPTLLNRDRIKALTEQHEEECEPSANPLAHETEHSSQAIALQFQQELETMETMPIPISLEREERNLAATEASDRRRELAQAAEKVEIERKEGSGSALMRASERKVKKQLNAKWVQSREDPANRPKGPLERPEEQELRETLFRTTARDLLRPGILFDESDAIKNSTFRQLNKIQLPVVTHGIVGLEGSYFEIA
ncbi:uncharacterized protein PHALS_10489 [Plasmopara halstedii]|uniref:Uncharacterized protein n=1 Tax=Plasmopara halstedii TaxID=4781 RepID=A0A0P1AHI3_PLAHL|nr:uncharacterized protein PHALS_10489 [Plasmopara halstedii]CEG40280.1 hypothetical protein PHALS_10489 [Plasmopara halstedii]|eukprot:XP_024576649.1 hypothetical protein PHALS_10489 [Plasmopara halstedii]